MLRGVTMIQLERWKRHLSPRSPKSRRGLETLGPGSAHNAEFTDLINLLNNSSEASELGKLLRHKWEHRFKSGARPPSNAEEELTSHGSVNYLVSPLRQFPRLTDWNDAGFRSMACPGSSNLQAANCRS